MAIIINGATGIDMGNTSVSNASQVDSVIINENGLNVATNNNLVGFKNYIINGNFDVWQYGTSQTTSAGYGSDDRWNNGHNGSTSTHSQITCTDTERALFNASKFSRTVVSSVVGAGNCVLKQQAIEDVTKLAGKTVTLSFWAKADSSKNIEVRMLQGFGSGGSPSAYVNNIGQQLVALTSTWQKKTITITVPSIIGKTLGTDGVHTTASWLRFTFDAGSGYDGSTVGQQSGTFDIAQVQLEEGSVATPFENRPYGLELSLCQRYYETGYFHGVSYGSSATLIQRTQAFYKCNKRISPSVTISKISGDVPSAAAGYGNASFFVVVLGSTDKGQELYGTYIASAEL